MTERCDLADAVKQVQPHIARSLADHDVQVTDRLLRAAITFAVNFAAGVEGSSGSLIRFVRKTLAKSQPRFLRRPIERQVRTLDEGLGS